MLEDLSQFLEKMEYYTTHPWEDLVRPRMAKVIDSFGYSHEDLTRLARIGIAHRESVEQIDSSGEYSSPLKSWQKVVGTLISIVAEQGNGEFDVDIFAQESSVENLPYVGNEAQGASIIMKSAGHDFGLRSNGLSARVETVKGTPFALSSNGYGVFETLLSQNIGVHSHNTRIVTVGKSYLDGDIVYDLGHEIIDRKHRDTLGRNTPYKLKELAQYIARTKNEIGRHYELIPDSVNVFLDSHTMIQTDEGIFECAQDQKYREYFIDDFFVSYKSNNQQFQMAVKAGVFEHVSPLQSRMKLGAMLALAATSGMLIAGDLIVPGLGTAATAAGIIYNKYRTEYNAHHPAGHVLQFSPTHHHYSKAEQALYKKCIREFKITSSI